MSTKQIKKEKVEELLTELKEHLAPMTLNLIGINIKQIGYTEEGLHLIEEAIDQMYRVGSKVSSFYVPFGFYLGQTIIENIPGAKWHLEDVAHIDDIAVLIGSDTNGHMAYPFRRIQKFWEDRTDGIVAMYKMVDMTVHNMDMIKNAPEKQWIQLPNGVQFRVTKEMKKKED